MTVSNPILAAGKKGVDDPEGCRVAILDYGAILGWPHVQAGPLVFRKGKEEWEKTLAAAQRLWLGTAWYTIEMLEHEWQLDREDERQAEIDKQKEANRVAVLTWKDQKTLDSGYYPTVITDIEETEGNYGPQLQFQFVVLDAEGDQTDSEIRGWCGMSWGEKSKLYAWSKAILGKRCPGPGQPMDTDRLKNKKCDIQVEVKPNQTQPGQFRSSIVGVFPFGTVSRKAPDDDEETGDEPF